VIATTHLDHLRGDVRAAQANVAVAELRKLAGNTQRLILIGDLNEAPGAGVTGALASHGLVDVWATLHAGDDGFTFPASAPSARIDYLWQSGLTAIAVERILDDPASSTYPSDHLGLRAVLE
jgi:endonuclease/exonuclease/phosphatase family metal-dependent hydrolase